jgi:hypothetical protein
MLVHVVHVRSWWYCLGELEIGWNSDVNLGSADACSHGPPLLPVLVTIHCPYPIKAHHLAY